MKRTWDESNSPQWRYLLGKESELRRATKRIFRGGDGEDTTDGGEIKRNKLGKKSKKAREKKNNIAAGGKEKQFTKQGKEIVYSASPGSECHFMHNNKPSSPSTLLKTPNEKYSSTRLSTESKEQE